MDSYWYAVLHEVVNKHNKNYFFRFSNVGEQLILDHVKERRARPRRRNNDEGKVYLGEPFVNTYLTRREYDCLLALLKGHTVKEVATLLELSPRTVEYYIKNIKVKFDCQSRSELLGQAIQLEIFQDKLAEL